MPNAVIVGASRGLGFEFVRQYLDAGWTVQATARQPTDLATLTTLGADAHQADVTDERSLRELAKAIDAPIDLLVANAGVGAREARLADIDPEDWSRVMTVNALGPLLVARALGSKVRSGGAIAALSSVMGSIADNGGGAWSYRMSKAALNMGLSCLAIELAPRDIKVVALHPGWVRTEMGGEEAPLEASESVAGMRRVIEAAGPGLSFVDYSGKPLPW